MMAGMTRLGMLVVVFLTCSGPSCPPSEAADPPALVSQLPAADVASAIEPQCTTVRLPRSNLRQQRGMN